MKESPSLSCFLQQADLAQKKLVQLAESIKDAVTTTGGTVSVHQDAMTITGIRRREIDKILDRTIEGYKKIE
jgi:hypothetical protein